MAKEQIKAEVVKIDFVKLVKEATQAQGASSFTRVNLKEDVTVEGLKALSDEYAKDGYEVFSNGKSVVLLKQ